MTEQKPPFLALEIIGRKTGAIKSFLSAADRTSFGRGFIAGAFAAGSRSAALMNIPMESSWFPSTELFERATRVVAAWKAAHS